MDHSTCSAWTMYLHGDITNCHISVPNGTNMPLPIATASQFNLYYHDLHSGTSIVQETTYCSTITFHLLTTYNYLFHIYWHTDFAVNHCNIKPLLFTVCHVTCTPVFLLCSSLFTGFLSYFSHCYICFCLVSCIVNLVLQDCYVHLPFGVHIIRTG
jgi:hypothetical protein